MHDLVKHQVVSKMLELIKELQIGGGIRHVKGTNPSGEAVFMLIGVGTQEQIDDAEKVILEALADHCVLGGETIQ